MQPQSSQLADLQKLQTQQCVKVYITAYVPLGRSVKFADQAKKNPEVQICKLQLMPANLQFCHLDDKNCTLLLGHLPTDCEHPMSHDKQEGHGFMA